MNPLRRLTAGVRWRIRRAVRRRHHRRGPLTVGRRRIRDLVIHASVPPGYTTEIGASLVAATKTLTKRGLVVVSPTELRDAGRRGWIGVTPHRNPDAFSVALRSAISPRLTVGPLRVILTSGRALGHARLTGKEARLLRPEAVSVLGDLLTAAAARRVTVILELPAPDRLRDEMLCSEVVEAGRPPATPPPLADGLYEELAHRIEALGGVDRVVTLVGDDATPARFAEAVWGVTGPISLPPAPAQATPRWTLRSMLAAVAVSPHLDTGERRLVRHHLRDSLAAEPARRPLAAVPDPVRASAVHVASAAESVHLHLHIGLQKTATTTIQAVLHEGRRQLADQGVAYVGRRFMMRMKDLRAWRAYAHSGGADFGSFALQLRTTVARHRTAFGSGRLETVLISNETIVGAMQKGPFLERPFRPRAEAAITDILDILQPDTCHLILLTRRQDTLLESQYMWQIHGGESFGFERYLASLFRQPDALSYPDLAARLESIPGVSSLTLLPYETIDGGLSPFINSIIGGTGARLDLASLAFDPVQNPSYSGRALEIALAVNPLLRGRKECEVVREHLRKSFPVATWGRAPLLDDAAREAVLGMFAAENEALFRRRMPQFPAGAYSSTATPDLLAQPLSNSLGTG